MVGYTETIQQRMYSTNLLIRNLVNSKIHYTTNRTKCQYPTGNFFHPLFSILSFHPKSENNFRFFIHINSIIVSRQKKFEVSAKNSHRCLTKGIFFWYIPYRRMFFWRATGSDSRPPEQGGQKTSKLGISALQV